MALTVIPLSIADVTLKLKDETGTPLTLTLIADSGTITIEDGEYEHFMAVNALGIPIADSPPRQAGPRGFCGFKIACKVFDASDNASDANIMDVLRNDGVVGSSWVESLTSPEASTVHTWNGEIVVADRGAVKGATYLFPDVRIEGNPVYNLSRDGGWMIDLAMRSVSTVKFTVTRTP